MISYRFFVLTTLLLFSSCTKKVYNKRTCTDLLFKKYKNILTLKNANEFDKNCKTIKIDYSMEICQQAFNNLFTGDKEKTLKKIYGAQIMNCFNESELIKLRKK